MGLIDLKTDLKSLKYGKDKIGGGSSKQPFVQKPIPESFSGIGNTGGLDMFVRGGSLVVSRTSDDISRLTQLLLTPSTFQGPAFTAQQNLLSRQGVETQASPKGVNEGFYLPTSTIAQVGVSAAGLHFNKQGINPIPGLPGSLVTYSDAVEGSFLNSGIKSVENNRLVKFAESFVNTKQISNTLYSYLGGPGSILGLGKTSINIPDDQRTGINTAGDTLLKFFGKNGVKNTDYEVYELLTPPGIEIPATKPPPEYTTEPVPALKYKAFTSPRSVNLDYRRYLSLSYNAGLADKESVQIRNGLAYGNNNLITLKTAPKGDRVSGIIPDATSRYALENKIGATLYQPISRSNNLITLKTAPKGTKIDGVALNKNSSYTNTNNLTGSLYIPVTGSASNSGSVPTDFVRASQPTLEANKQSQVVPNLQSYTYTQTELQQAPSYRQSGRIQDFREKFRNKRGNALAVGADVIAPNYVSQNIENRVHLGNPGTKGDISNYVTGKVVQGKSESLDKINALPIYNSADVAKTKDETVNDLVKFRIAILDPDGGPNKSFIHFRAFLDTITDNYSAQWDSFKYVGRGENFYTYGGFERSVSMGWTVFAQSKQELIPMYKKLNFLASTLAPSYNNSFMQGTFAQLTIGGYLYEMPGIIKGLSYELSQEAPWEIGITGEGFVGQKSDSSVKELPHMIKVSGFEFIPIPNFIPQRQTVENGSSRYISLSNGAGNNYDS
jgi:hypothetical protein